MMCVGLSVLLDMLGKMPHQVKNGTEHVNKSVWTRNWGLVALDLQDRARVTRLYNNYTSVSVE